MYDDDDMFSSESFSDWLSDEIFTSDIMAMPDYAWGDEDDD